MKTGSERNCSSLKAVILVGGEGTRLQPLTYYMPKPMVPVLNRPFLEHTIAYLEKCGVKDVVLAESYLPEVVHDYFGDGSNLGVRLAYNVENTPRGTAGAVKNAEQYLNGTFIVLNGDVFPNIDIVDMVDFHRRRGAKVTIALTWVDNPGAFGVVETDSDGRVRHFIEKPGADRVTTHWINAGVYILEPEVLGYVPADEYHMFEKELFPLLLELGQPVYGYSSGGYWLDMGTPEKYLCLNCDLLSSKAQSALSGELSKSGIYRGKDVSIHSSARIAGPAVIGNRCKIDREATIKGPVVIGADCYIGKSASIENAILWENDSIGTGAKLKRCILGSNTRVDDNAQVIRCVLVTDSDGVTRAAEM